MNLNNVIAKAQRLMLDENFNRDVERVARAQRLSTGIGNGGDLADLDAALFGVSSAPQGTDIYQKVPIQESATQYRQKGNNYDGVQIVQEVQEKRNPRASKLPSAIIESFEKVPFQGDAFDISGGALAGLNLVKEQAQPQQVPLAQQANGAINYDLIKYIVNEAVQNALKGQLNESVSAGIPLKGMRIAPGNMFQFLDSKGNLYEAKLTLKKKAK